MRTGCLMEVAAVLKSLLQLGQQKPLSFREKKMLERARYLLVSELAMARNWEETGSRGGTPPGTGKIKAALSRGFSHRSLRPPLPPSKPRPAAGI